MPYYLQKLIDANQEVFQEHTFQKEEHFVRRDNPNRNIGIIIQGIMRGYVSDESGEDINMLFFMEGDVVSGNIVAGLPSALDIQCLEECVVRIADFPTVMSIIRSDPALEKRYNTTVNHLHERIQARLSTLIHFSALEKYAYFLKQYPNVINRIPHYYVAGFLGITPTQLSRIRKQYVKNPSR